MTEMRPVGPSIDLATRVSKRSLAWNRLGNLAGCGLAHFNETGYAQAIASSTPQFNNGVE
jgi:hypothetical protein